MAIHSEVSIPAGRPLEPDFKDIAQGIAREEGLDVYQIFRTPEGFYVDLVTTSRLGSDPERVSLAMKKAIDRMAHYFGGTQLPLPTQVVRPEDSVGVDLEEFESDVMEHPFNPAKIRIDYKPMTVDLFAKRLAADEIDLAPAFQRDTELWTPETQSRLIESMLIRIPIPAFYLDASDDEKWLVVDGLQRLAAISKFMVKNELELTGLEFLKLNGRRWSDLDRPLKRRIEETQVVTYIIQPGTPPDVKFNIFRRINTGGLSLSPQEIRHAINQGPAIELLRKLAESEDFIRATAGGLKGKSDRMVDRECVLRFLAFAMTSPEQYKSQDLDTFLNSQMKVINQMTSSERTALEDRFRLAMQRAFAVFGDDAFRKRYSKDAPRSPINKALFEAWSVNLANLSLGKASLLSERASIIQGEFVSIMQDSEFDRSITSGTGKTRNIAIRFSRIRQILERSLR